MDSIACGSGTADIDDPMLTCRIPGDYSQPLRVILIRRPVYRSGASWWDRRRVGDTCVCHRIRSRREDQGATEAWHPEVVVTGTMDGQVDVGEALLHLGSREPAALSLLLEGGPTLAASFVESGTIDKVMTFIAPKFIGGKEARTPVEGAVSARG